MITPTLGTLMDFLRWIIIVGLMVVLTGCQSGEEHEVESQTGQTSNEISTGEMENNIGLPGRQTTGAYKLFADFSANQGEIVIQNDSIFVYSSLTGGDDIYDANLMDSDSPSVNGTHLLTVYHWEHIRFILIREDTVTYQPMATEAIDRDNSVDLSISNVAAQRAIADIRDDILIKHQLTRDLNNDGTPEYLLVYSREKAGEFGYFYGILILEQSRGRYTIAYQYRSDFQSYVGNMIVKDLTGDGQPEIILYEVDFGASGYTAYAQIFGVDQNQDYAAYGDE